MRKQSVLATGALAAIALATPAFSVVVPNASENTAGGGTFLGPLSNSPRIYQLLIDDSQLTAQVGQQLNSITWRLLPSATASFPSADQSFANFDIRLSGSVEPSARSLTFADNVVGTQTLVRTGPLAVPLGSFKDDDTSPQPFGMEVEFQTPYLYTGGNLLIELRHTGISGGSSSVDAILTSNPMYGTLVSAAWSGTAGSPTGAQGNAVITQIGVLVPEPGTMSLAAIGLTMLGRRRRSA